MTVTIVGIALVSNIADAQFRVCPRYTPSGTSVVIRSHHSFGLSTVGQPNPWPTNVSNAYDLSWSGWWYLNTANYAWWWGRGFVSNGYSGWDGVEAIQRSNGFGLVGQTQPYVWPADQIQEADFRIDGPTTSSPASLTDAVSFTSTCIGADQPVFTTETTALVHELGHGYGFGHFNDYLSNMNTFDVGIISCEVGTSPGAGMSMLITPSAQPTQCMDIVYGIPPGIDLSITPLVQPTDCWLAVGDECAQRFGLGPGIPQEFAHAATSGTTTIEFTQLNNLDAYSANPVTAIYFSQDAYIDSTDVRVLATTIPTSGFLQGEVHGRRITFSFNPTIALPTAGSLYRALVRVDDTGLITETRESNNATDTRYWFRRL